MSQQTEIFASHYQPPLEGRIIAYLIGPVDPAYKDHLAQRVQRIVDHLNTGSKVAGMVFYTIRFGNRGDVPMFGIQTIPAVLLANQPYINENICAVGLPFATDLKGLEAGGLTAAPYTPLVYSAKVDKNRRPRPMTAEQVAGLIALIAKK